jgi:four helix bundle protein
MESYQELKVWQKAREVVVEIYRITKEFPRDEIYGLVSQMRRAAVSVPSNIAEGWGRTSTKDYIRFLKIARGSILELETQIIISCDLEYINEEIKDKLINGVGETGKMINGLIKSLNPNP